jgi:predicted PurR-regulated permease PerM
MIVYFETFTKKSVMNTDMPVTVRRALELLGLYFLGVIIVAGQGIIMPLVLAFFISIVLLPVYNSSRAIFR